MKTTDAAWQACSDERWRRLTAEGNAAFAAGDLSGAARRYEEARVEAELHFDNELLRPSNADAPNIALTLVTISGHNLAHLALRMNQADRATVLLGDTFERLVRIAESTDALPSLRAAAAKNLAPALAEMLGHLSTLGRDGDAPALLARAHDAFLSVSNAPTFS